MSANAKTVCQPSDRASMGPKNVARAVPLLPAPAMPIANPWCCGGYQRLASGSATAKLAPATPNIRPTSSICGSESAHSQPSSSGTADNVMPIRPVRRAPTRSVISPRTRRRIEPPRSGTATMSVFRGAIWRRYSSVVRPGGFGQKSAEMLTAKAPISTQIMKLVSK